MGCERSTGTPDGRRLRHRPLLWLIAGWIGLAAVAARGEGPLPLQFADGERIVLIGNTLIEHEQMHGYLETLIATRHPDRNISFRNLGWSGDTVWAESRPGRLGGLLKLVRELEPTVVIVGYGTNESFAGEAGLGRFAKGVDELLRELAQGGARLIVVSPIRHERANELAAAAGDHNEVLARYVGAMRKAAEDDGVLFVDLFERSRSTGGRQPEMRLTDNGVHPTGGAYWQIAQWIEEGMGFSARRCEIEISARSGMVRASGAKVTDVEVSKNSVRFVGTDEMLPLPIEPLAPDGAAGPGEEGGQEARWIKITGLEEEARYALKIDGVEVASANGREWSAGVAVSRGPQFDQVETLRKVINKKDLLYFHRWRPQNEMYLFGGRKHEQGQNAVEIPQFDPLVEAKEREIAQLRRPAAHEHVLEKR